MIPAAILLAIVAVIGIAFWPGRMNADTLVEISEMRSGVFSNQYAPILEAVWRPFYRHGIGPGWILTGQLLVFVTGAFVVLRRQIPPLIAAIVVGLISLSPQAFGELGLVGRDTWFLSLMVATFAFADLALFSSGRRRTAYCVGAVVCAWLTLASRQNAATSVFLPLGLLAAPWLKQRISAARRNRLVLVVCATAAGLVATLALYGTQVAVDDAIDVHNTHSSAQLYLYDLAFMSRDANRDYIPTSVFPSRSMSVIRTDSNDVSSNALLFGSDPPIRYPFTAQAAATLKHAWIHRIESDPLSWAQERLQTFGALVGVTSPSVWIYHPFIDPNSFGYTTTFPGANKVATQYESSFANKANNGDAIFRVWPYLLIACLIAPLMLGSRNRARVLIGTFALAAILYQIGFLLALMGTNYRYEFPPIVMYEMTIALALAVGCRELASRYRTPDRKASVSASASGVPIS